MAERILIVALLLGLAFLCALAVRALVRRRVQAIIGRPVPGELRRRLAPQRSTLVYFYGPLCLACSDQANAIDELVREVGVPVLKFDVTRERALANSLGAVTVPTTAIIDSAGLVRQVNLGYHPKAFLAAQISTSSLEPARTSE